MNYEKYSLQNKADVILIPLNDTQSVTVLIMLPVGSRYETEKMQGVSHYIEHLLFKGTKKRKNSQILTREIDRLGAEYNAFTGKEYTGYYIKTDARYIGIALDILSDMLYSSLFDPKEMEKEKTVIVEEIRMYNDNPVMNIDVVFEDLMYHNNPLGRDIAGTEKHVMNLKRDDVLLYKQKHYQPENLNIVIAGKIDEQTKKTVEKFFGGQNNAAKVKKDFQPSQFGSAEKEHRLKLVHKKTDQAQIMLGFPGFCHTDKNNNVSTILNTVLGGSMSSRLFVRIREKAGLAYTVRSGSDTFRDTGYLYVRAALEARNINKAVKLIKEEIEKIKNKGVTKRELRDAKTHIHGSISLSMEDSSSQAGWYARQNVFMDRIYTPQERLEMIDKVENEEIIQLARKVYDFQEMRLAVIGDVKIDEIKI